MSELAKDMTVAAEQERPHSTNALAALLHDPEKLAAIPVETVERLWAIQKELDADHARRAYAAAFNRLQSRMEPVKKKAKNTQTASMYARAEDVEKMLDPLLADEGFSCSVSTLDCPVDDHIRVVLRVRHVAGHEEMHHLDAPIDSVGMKGNPTKTRLHGMGSTLTYVRRFLKCSVFNVPLVADDDGNQGGRTGPGAERITEDQAADLESLMEEVQANRDAFFKFFGIRAPGELPVARHREAVRMLEAKRRR